MNNIRTMLAALALTTTAVPVAAETIDVDTDITATTSDTDIIARAFATMGNGIDFEDNSQIIRGSDGSIILSKTTTLLPQGVDMTVRVSVNDPKALDDDGSPNIGNSTITMTKDGKTVFIMDGPKITYIHESIAAPEDTKLRAELQEAFASETYPSLVKRLREEITTALEERSDEREYELASEEVTELAGEILDNVDDDEIISKGYDDKGGWSMVARATFDGTDEDKFKGAATVTVKIDPKGTAAFNVAVTSDNGTTLTFRNADLLGNPKTTVTAAWGQTAPADMQQAARTIRVVNAQISELQTDLRKNRGLPKLVQN